MTTTNQGEGQRRVNTLNPNTAWMPNPTDILAFPTFNSHGWKNDDDDRASHGVQISTFSMSDHTHTHTREIYQRKRERIISWH
jgi:hypothetical protein